MEQAACKPLDPAQFASCVRQIAMEAHRLLKDPFATPDELMALSRRIDNLRRSSPGGKTSNISHWLENVEDLLDSRDTLHA